MAETQFARHHAVVAVAATARHADASGSGATDPTDVPYQSRNEAGTTRTWH